jgi:hypothetical protein
MFSKFTDNTSTWPIFDFKHHNLERGSNTSLGRFRELRTAYKTTYFAQGNHCSITVSAILIVCVE